MVAFNVAPATDSEIARYGTNNACAGKESIWPQKSSLSTTEAFVKIGGCRHAPKDCRISSNKKTAMWISCNLTMRICIEDILSSRGFMAAKKNFAYDSRVAKKYFPVFHMLPRMADEFEYVADLWLQRKGGGWRERVY